MILGMIIFILFLIIYFIVYPVLGLIFQTTHPIVAVVSESMEHSPSNQILCGEEFTDFKDSFENYWSVCGSWYQEQNIFPEQFQTFPFANGFNKGDLVIVWGTKPKNLEIGDVLIFKGSKPQPIIHRITNRWLENNHYFFQTKGDHNQDSIAGFLGETSISEQRVLGKGLLRIPSGMPIFPTSCSTAPQAIKFLSV